MTNKSLDYFNNIIMPFIRYNHSDILDEMSLIIAGSVGLGIDDEFSDLEANIFLPDELWKQSGLLQINLDKYLAETNLWRQAGSGIQVYPFSWMLDGNGAKILAGCDINWDNLAVDSLHGLYVLHNHPILHDPKDRLGELRRMTAPEKMPETCWKKALLSKIDAFVSNGVLEIRRCIDRQNFTDAYIPFGDAVKALFEIGFIICHQYYPYRKHLSWAFRKLASPISDLRTQFDMLPEAKSWRDRLSLLERIYCAYKEHIILTNQLPELDFNRVNLREMPLHENAFYNAENLIDNPNFLIEVEEKKEKAVELGFDAKSYWAVEWFGMK